MNLRSDTKKIAVCLLLIFTTISNPMSVSAAAPYNSYSYNYWGDVVVEPAPYTVFDVISGNDVSKELGDFNSPSDMFTTNGRIYVADSGNNRIVVLKEDFTLDFIITEFVVPNQDNNREEASDVTEEDKAKPNIPDPYSSHFNNPQGIYVSNEGHIYVADTYNSRILEFDDKGQLLRMIGKPNTPLLSSSFTYKPMKLVVDDAGRIYISAYGVNLGLIELSPEGEFKTFTGAIEVTTNFVDYIWKHYFSTNEQQDRMVSNIPTEYSNLFIDNRQFIYGTISTLSEKDIAAGADVIRRLNPSGKDVLRRLGNLPIVGDRSSEGDRSKFVDITALESGVYFALDAVQGKIFAYDYDGNLLFVFGKLGNRWGNTKSPIALNCLNNGTRLLVLDYLNNSIYVYDITEYGSSILHALEFGYGGSMKQAVQAWENVLRLNSNNEYAYLGIGRYYLQEKEYKAAMEYFKKVNNRSYYSKAYSLNRKSIMQDSFGIYIMLFIAVSAIITLITAIKRFNAKVRRER
ncbi:hypothetical protein HNQ56_001390 [Anaerotaenia torta]|uniref:hypothetical protein n=1 Tax=Anaerotaenia torta TaxID=433293 RepID=UPI003D1D27A0